MRIRRSLKLAVLTASLAVLAACGSGSGSDGSTADNPAEATGEVSCAIEDLPLKTAGHLTVGAASPAYEPWYVDNDPSNGKGYESAVAYAVADRLGFPADHVTWVKVPFDNAYAPGAKEFDFDIDQISITPERAKVVDFSDGYYVAAQAVVVLDKAEITANSVVDLKGLTLGAQTGTTSLTAIREQVKPSKEPAVFRDTNAAKQALLNGQVDGIVTDLPTAFYITAAEIEGSSILGQFQQDGDEQEQFGMLFEKDSGLVSCVDEALASLKEDGTLAALEKEWLSDTVDVPVLR